MIQLSQKLRQFKLGGNREIQISIECYHLDMIISVGYLVKSQKDVVYRKWATSILKDYMM